MIGEHKTNGQDVIVLRGNGSAFHWVDAASCGVEVSGEWAATATAGPEWRTMSEAEAWAWLCMVPKRIEGIPDDDWQGMYHIAAKRAQVAEDALAAVRKAVQASEVKPLPPGTYYTEHVEHATKISEARRLALVEIRGILGMEVGK